MEHGYVSTPEGQIHYVTAGDGETADLVASEPALFTRVPLR